MLIFDNYYQLWKSDGTTSGTSAIATITITGTHYVVLNNKVYFAGDITNQNPIVDQLWQTDGTANGTTLVKKSIQRDGHILTICLSMAVKFISTPTMV